MGGDKKIKPSQMETYQYKRIASGDANSTVTVCSGPCVLKSITINTTSAHALTVKETAASGTAPTIATIKASVAEQTLEYNIAVDSGLQVSIPASYVGDATIAFKPL